VIDIASQPMASWFTFCMV